MRKEKRRIIIRTLLLVALLFTLFCGIGYAEEATNTIQLEKEYQFCDLEVGFMDGYTSIVTVPSNGRIRVWMKDCDCEKYDDDLYADLYFRNLREDKQIRDSRRWKKSVDQMNSGWITVTPGEWEVYIKINGSAEGETLFIEYEREGQFIGETESNDTFSTANDIVSGQTYEGNFSDGVSDELTSADNDYFKFTLDGAGMVSINLTNTYNDKNNVPFELYRADENNNKKMIFFESSKTKLYYDDIKTTYNFRLPEGDYFVKLELHWKDSAEYKLKVDYHIESSDAQEKEFNNSSRTANLIKSKRKYTANLNDEKDVDWYKIYLETDGMINVELWKPEDVGNNNLQITLYDPDMKKLYSKTTGSDVYYASKKKTVSAGTYYVRVKSGSNGLESIYDYQIRVNAVPIIKPVTNLKATLTDYKTYKITWKPSKGADGYNIYAKKGAKGQYVKKGFTTENMFSVKWLTAGSKYDFVVAPCLLNDEKYEEVEYALNNVSAYTLKKITQNKVKKASASKAQISWKDINGESGYEICKMAKKDEAYVELSMYKTSKTSIKTTAKKGVKYYYKVRAYKKIGSAYIYAPWSAVKAYQL